MCRGRHLGSGRHLFSFHIQLGAVGLGLLWVSTGCPRTPSPLWLGSAALTGECYRSGFRTLLPPWPTAAFSWLCFLWLLLGVCCEMFFISERSKGARAGCLEGRESSCGGALSKARHYKPMPVVIPYKLCLPAFISLPQGGKTYTMLT